jgi:hypothetical protein
MNINDYPIPARPFAVMESRIIAATAAGKKLADVTYDRECHVHHMGADDLPMIQPTEFTFFERVFGGRSQTPALQGNTQLVSEAKVGFFVIGRREYGFTRAETADGKGVMEWASILMDVIETNVGGGVAVPPSLVKPDIQDAFLLGTLAKPVTFDIKENFVAELSLIVLVECTLFSVPYWRAGRS